MKKFLYLFVLLIFLYMPAFSQTLTGGLEYTIDKARIVAFDNSPMRISKDEFKANLNDPFFYSNTGFIKGKISEVMARKVVPFYDNNKLCFYGVQYNNDKSKKYYYSLKGNLLKVDICYDNGQYPYKAISYNSKGKLITVHLAISDTESFLFDSNKNLIGHWINNQFYNAKGEKEITRRL